MAKDNARQAAAERLLEKRAKEAKMERGSKKDRIPDGAGTIDPGKNIFVRAFGK